MRPARRGGARGGRMSTTQIEALGAQFGGAGGERTRHSLPSAPPAPGTGGGAAAEHHRELAEDAACASGDPALVLLVRAGAAQERTDQGAARAVLAGLDTALTALGTGSDSAEQLELCLAAECLRGSAHLALGE